MQLENLLSAADPARQAQIDEADSPRAAALYERIVGTPSSLGGGGVPASAPGRAHFRTHSRRPTTRMFPRLRVTAAIAGAVVVAVAVGLVASDGGSRAPHKTLADGGGKPSASPRSSVSSRPSPSPSQPVRLNQAGAVLDSLAAVAAGGAPATLVPGPGQYLYVLDIELKGAPQGGGLSMPCYGSMIRQQWLANDGSGRQVGYSPGCGSNQSRFTQSWGTSGNGLNFDYLRWEGLPTTPAAMEAAIVKQFERGHANNPSTFQLATTILNVAAPPAVRAALFRMLATMPDVRYLGKVTDPLGRTGDTIAFVEKPDDIVAIFDPKTGQVLDALLVPHTFHIARHLPPWDTPEMYLETGIVDSIKATPPGTKKLLSEIPYRHWVS